MDSILVTDAAASAEQVKLLYVSDEKPGYGRRRRGKGFCYVDQEGVLLRDPSLVSRFRQLRIPPAWQDVWICPRSNCHIQATGRDSRRRKQYIYHPRWNEARSSTKFDLLIPFASVLPSIRARVDLDLRRPTFSRETVLAFVVALLEQTLIRVGNEEYVRQNHSFGLTTLRDYHVVITGSILHLKFRGKRGKNHEIDIRNRRLASLAKKYQELPGQELLKYEEGPGDFKVVDSGDVNEYLRAISGSDFTAKDFRTWGGTVFAARELHRIGPAASVPDARKKISYAMKETAAKLGNTATICRKYYVAPQIIDAYIGGALFDVMLHTDRRNGDQFELDSDEKAVFKILKAV